MAAEVQCSRRLCVDHRRADRTAVQQRAGAGFVYMFLNRP